MMEQPMRPIRIVPEYALVFKYDVRTEMQETYFRYVIGEFTPALQEMRVYLQEAWHVAYGEYPERQIEYITDDLNNIKRLLNSKDWERLEDRLKEFTYNYTRRITRYSGRFKV
jgi:hypothetical protein